MHRHDCGRRLLRHLRRETRPHGGPLPVAATDYTHQEYFENYEGTTTCLECHEDEAESFFHSQHYQWKGESPGLVNSEGQRLGKANTINDFCTNPMASWIDLIRNSRGEIVSKGCSKCHAGNGLKPEEELSQAQLENIDCLICHARGYRRDLYETEEGGLEWRPILWKNQEGLNSVSKRIVRPERVMCLRCHSASGGGPNFKRGDLEYALADPEPDFDVHVANEGKALLGVRPQETKRVAPRSRGRRTRRSSARSSSCSGARCPAPWSGCARRSRRVMRHRWSERPTRSAAQSPWWPVHVCSTSPWSWSRRGGREGWRARARRWPS